MPRQGEGSSTGSSGCSVQASLPLACVWETGEGEYFRRICRLSPFFHAVLSAVPGTAFLLENGENQSNLELAGCIHPGGAGSFWVQEPFLCCSQLGCGCCPQAGCLQHPALGARGDGVHGRGTVPGGHKALSPATGGDRELGPADFVTLCPVQVRRRPAAFPGPSARRSAPASTPLSAAATSTSRPCPRGSPRMSQSCEWWASAQNLPTTASDFAALGGGVSAVGLQVSGQRCSLPHAHTSPAQ